MADDIMEIIYIEYYSSSQINSTIIWKITWKS
jgi:archaellum component FlaD/FlaE